MLTVRSPVSTYLGRRTDRNPHLEVNGFLSVGYNVLKRERWRKGTRIKIVDFKVRGCPEKEVGKTNIRGRRGSEEYRGVAADGG